MNKKWADYLISKIRYDESRSYITDLFIHKDAGDTVKAGTAYSRESVVNAITNGNSFNTIYQGNNGWKNGAGVNVIRIGNEKYLRTDSNNVKKDNLGELPEF